jgi:hypothetical protein
MKRLPKWMRGILLASAVYNAFGVLVFIPLLSIGRRLIGIPDAPGFYLWLVTIWIGSFGVLYCWLGATGRPDRAFLIIAATGKFAFWSLTVVYWWSGDFPAIAPLVASGDLIGAIAFTWWLAKTND